ncbi:MAG: NAD-dependent epimerase/dehydratase family protein [Gemmatimonadaceae bacterium]
MAGDARAVAVIGAGGYVGRLVVRALLEDRRGVDRILALDVRPVGFADPSGVVAFEEMDVRSARLGELVEEHRIDTVVHLAAVLNPPPGMTRNEQYAIDVDGTHNVLEACVEHAVRQVVVTSSGDAYGYHVDNPAWIDEHCPLRGNDEVVSCRHKRLAEELLARYRQHHPELLQLIFRPGMILGGGARNQFTALFERPVMLQVSNGESRYVFVWDEDVAACIVKGIHERRSGVYNLAADGAMTAQEIAGVTGAQLLSLPAGVMSSALGALHWLGLTDQGAEQVPYLRHRPVLSNDALKRDFGFTPSKTSREVFEAFWKARGKP